MQAEEVPCSVLSMNFFDRLWQQGIVRESGNIIKCFDEPCEEFLISDKLREVRLASSPGPPFIGGPGLRCHVG